MPAGQMRATDLSLRSGSLVVLWVITRKGKKPCLSGMHALPALLASPAFPGPAPSELLVQNEVLELLP